MIISGRVPEQYTDLVTGINSLVASGLASGDIDQFYLYVDDSYYTGVFNVTVPNSGDFYVFGSGTLFAPQGTCTIGTQGDGSFNWVNTEILGEDTASWLFNISGASTITFDRSSIIYPLYGISTESGTLNIENSFIAGSGAGIFYSGYNFNASNVDVSQFSTGINAYSSTVQNSNIFECTIGIDVDISGTLNLSRTLMHDCVTDVNRSVGSSIIIEECTLEGITPLHGSGGIITTNSTIYDSAIRVIHGFLASGSLVENCGLYPSGWATVDVVNVPTSSGNTFEAPNFNNSTYGDYRLKFDYTNGSPYVEHISKSVPSDVDLRVELSNIVATDYRGPLDKFDIQKFIYKQGSTLMISDYNKEIEYAYFIKKNYPLSFISTTQASFSLYEPNLKSTLSSDGNHDQPYDWDLKTFESSEIVDHPTDLQYIVPRTYLDLKPLVSNKLAFLGDADFRFDKMSKANIKVYDQELSRGISYDYGLSNAGEPVLWRLEGRNQLLIKQNPFTNEDLKVYPILSPELNENTVIKISGLVYVGPEDDKYRFIDVNDPDKSYIGENEQGYFKWIDTSLNLQFDIRGILAYKNNLYVAGTRYSEDIYDRTNIPELDGAGYLLRYYNDSKLSHYLTALDSLGTRRMSLNDSNSIPTDLTIYEDGNLFIADYANISGVYRYQFAYDYALLNEYYDKLSRVWLREFYPTVNF